MSHFGRSTWSRWKEGMATAFRKRNRSKQDLRRKFRRQIVEQLESRELMALSILSVSPLDGSTNVPLSSNPAISRTPVPALDLGSHLPSETNL